MTLRAPAFFEGPVTLAPSTFASARASNDSRSFEAFETEILQSLVRRALARSRRDRERSPTDAIASSLATARSALIALRRAAERGEIKIASIETTIFAAYTWAVRVSHELEAVEASGGDADDDWSRLERFAPAAVASFDQTIGDFAGSPESGDRGSDAASEARRAVDAVCAHFDFALRATLIAA